MTGPQHLQRANRQHLVSQVCPPQLLTLPRHRCYLFSQSHQLPCSSALDRTLIAWRWAWPRIPRSLSSLVVVLPTKPLQATSTGQTLAFQPCCSASAAGSVYLRLRSTTNFQSRATPSRPRSDVFLVVVFDGFAPSRTKPLAGIGWDGGGMAVMDVRLVSSVAARHFSTWLCRQVYRPCVRLFLPGCVSGLLKMNRVSMLGLLHTIVSGHWEMAGHRTLLVR